MTIKLLESFRKSTRELRHPKIAQFLPSAKQEFGYNSSFHILSQALALPNDDPRDAQWELALIMHSAYESLKATELEGTDTDVKRATRADVLRQLIRDNVYLYKEECRLLRLPPKGQSVDTKDVVSFNTGREISPHKAFFMQPDINDPFKEAGKTADGKPSIGLVKK